MSGRGGNAVDDRVALSVLQPKRVIAMSGEQASGKETDIHDGVIESIAAQYHMDEQQVRVIYEDELSKLKLGSRIKPFFPVLCTRHVKEILLHTGRLHHA